MASAQPWPLVPANTPVNNAVYTGSAASDDQVLMQAALDGALPYNDQGRATLQKYAFEPTLPSYTGPGVYPPQVQAWLTDYWYQDIPAGIKFYIQATVPGWGNGYSNLVELNGRMLDVRRLQMAGNFSPYVPPGGGMFPAFSNASLTADLPGASVAQAVAFLKVLANNFWLGMTQQMPELFTYAPARPFPEAPVTVTFTALVAGQQVLSQQGLTAAAVAVPSIYATTPPVLGPLTPEQQNLLAVYGPPVTPPAPPVQAVPVLPVATIPINASPTMPAPGVTSAGYPGGTPTPGLQGSVPPSNTMTAILVIAAALLALTLFRE